MPRKPAPTQAVAIKAASAAASAAEVIKEVEERYVAADSPDLPTAIDSDDVHNVTPSMLAEGLTKLRSLDTQVQKEAERIAQESERLQDERTEVEALRREALGERAAAEETTASMSEREERLLAEQRLLLEREEAIAEREVAAEGGFLEQRRTSLRAFYEEKERLLGEIGELQADLFRQQQEIPRIVKERIDEVASQHNLQLAGQRHQIEAERLDLEREREMLRSDRDRLQVDRTNLSAREMNVREDEELAIARAEARAGALLEQERLRADQLQRRLEAAVERLHASEQQLDESRRASDRFSGRSPAEVLGELERLQAEKHGLQERLSNALSGDAVVRLRQLEADRQVWDDERLQLVQEAQQLRAMLERARTAVGEVELARDTIKSLEVRVTAYREAIEAQRADWEQLVEQGRTELPFPECSRMDDDPKCQTPPRRLAEPGDLRSLVADTRNRMATLPGPEARYYSLRDVRVFLAGLAMSRLHLLQGISGTGKTSLPLSFAAAIGAGKAVVEVQAGWRDRDDLLGHYNAFEGKFYEKDVTQALYESQCPSFSAVPYFIVLDEMNLSHPEQYFADFLSELEQASSGRRIALRTERTIGAPRLFDEGRFLRIPPNVWFIGTANQDETTVGFADKTYDRAHVMELPHHHEPFKPKSVRSAAQPVRYESLQQLFDAAASEHQSSADLVDEYLNSDVGEVLRERFGVGWGNRLVNQVKAFVPVILSADGDVGEAADHLLATKLLRKVRDRHDVLLEDFELLRKAVESSWPMLGPAASAPLKSSGIIAHELRRLGGTHG